MTDSKLSWVKKDCVAIVILWKCLVFPKVNTIVIRYCIDSGLTKWVRERLIFCRKKPSYSVCGLFYSQQSSLLVLNFIILLLIFYCSVYWLTLADSCFKILVSESVIFYSKKPSLFSGRIILQSAKGPSSPII